MPFNPIKFLKFSRKLRQIEVTLGENLKTSQNLAAENRHLLENLLHNQGAIQARELRDVKHPFPDAEFKVFSQGGDDGILQWLVRHVNCPQRYFVEFGVENYEEANTRYLALHNRWAGLVIEGDANQARRITHLPRWYEYNVDVQAAYITAENIEELFRKNDVPAEPGIISIDIDGNDYWVWKAIQHYRPAIFILEYNWIFGAEKAVTVPYDPGFTRAKAHHSNLYFGASLGALHKLGAEKGYSLVGCSSFGNNAYFVRDDLRPADLPARTAPEAFMMPAFREARGPGGQQTFLKHEQARQLIAHLPVVEV